MKTVQQLPATILLVLALGIPTFAGDISVPVGSPPPPPPDHVTTTFNDPTDVAPEDIDLPALTLLALDFLLDAFPMY